MEDGPLVARHNLQSQAIYSELVESLQVAEIEALRDREGSLTRREINGHFYWYVRRRIGHRVHEAYLGPETEELLGRLDQVREEIGEAKEAARQRRGLIRMLRTAGYLVPDRRTGRVLEELAAAGVFRLEGVLVGTHAFRCYGALLGARLADALAATNDVDIAQSKSLAVGLGDTASPALGEALARAEKFVRVPEMDPRHPSTSWRTRDGSLRVDVLTPSIGRGAEGPVELRSLGTHATALKFLDFLLAETVPAVVLTGSGVLVRVPSAARFALHKVLISQRRPETERLKATKDLAQARVLLEVLLRDDADQVGDLWAELLDRGRSWAKAAKNGALKLPKELRDALL